MNIFCLKKYELVCSRSFSKRQNKNDIKKAKTKGKQIRIRQREKEDVTSSLTDVWYNQIFEYRLMLILIDL